MYICLLTLPPPPPPPTDDHALSSHRSHTLSGAESLACETRRRVRRLLTGRLDAYIAMQSTA